MAGTHPPLPATLALLIVASVMLAGCSNAPEQDFTCGPPEEPRTCGFFEARRAEAAFTEVEERYRATAHLANLMRMDPEGNHDLSLLHEYATDPFLTDSLLLQDEYKSQGIYLEGELPITRIDRLHYSEEVLTMAACSDGTNLAARSIETNEFSGYGDIVRIHFEATPHQEEWILSSGEQVDPTPCEN